MVTHVCLLLASVGGAQSLKSRMVPLMSFTPVRGKSKLLKALRNLPLWTQEEKGEWVLINSLKSFLQ